MCCEASIVAILCNCCAVAPVKSAAVPVFVFLEPKERVVLYLAPTASPIASAAAVFSPERLSYVFFNASNSARCFFRLISSCLSVSVSPSLALISAILLSTWSSSDCTSLSSCCFLLKSDLFYKMFEFKKKINPSSCEDVNDSIFEYYE